MSNDSVLNRKSLRLNDFDYTSANAYFVTACAQGRAALFSRVVDGLVEVSAAGEIVQTVWEELPQYYPNIELDEFVVMPNHVHGILWIVEPKGSVANDVGAQHAAPLRTMPKLTPGSLGAIVRSLKSACTKRINEMNGVTCVRIWQRSYYDHIIRNDDDLYNTRRYIRENPLKWELDEYHA
ncbi:MAG: transposase [Chloroflexi bacterium]|nr:transposase [Chloroflexota bacterium]